MQLPMNKIVSSEKETVEIAKQFSEMLSGNEIVLLNGELGTGKTFFVKSLCSVYGITSVSSPSFAIVNEYHNSKKFTHFDFYRIKKVEELYDIGIEDYLTEGNSVVFIEWANLFPEVLPKKNYQIDFKFVSNSTREIRIQRNG